MTTSKSSITSEQLLSEVRKTLLSYKTQLEHWQHILNHAAQFADKPINKRLRDKVKQILGENYTLESCLTWYQITVTDKRLRYGKVSYSVSYSGIFDLSEVHRLNADTMQRTAEEIESLTARMPEIPMLVDEHHKLMVAVWAFNQKVGNASIISYLQINAENAELNI